MSELPKGWTKTTVGDLADSIQYGHTASSTTEEIGPRFLRITDIQDNSVDWTSVPFCPIPEKQIPKYRLEKGDLLFARTGATVGKSFLIQSEIPESVFASYLIRVRVTKAIEARYLYYFFQSSEYWHQISDSSSGIGQPNVNGKKLAAITLPIAPLPEQRRIVARIEELFSRLDAGVAALRHAKAQLQRYRKSVLAAAVTGQLTHAWREQHPDTEPVEELLKRILKQRREQWSGRGKYKEPSPYVNGVFDALPSGWKVGSLEEITDANRPICYGILMPKENLPDGVLYVKVRDMRGDRINLESLHRTSPEIAAKYERASLKEGDLLLSIRGTYGRIAIIPVELEGGNITQDSARLAVSPELNRDYVACAIRSHTIQTYFKKVARGVAVKGVNIGDVKPTPIPIPPLAEQHQIVAEVEARTTAIDHLEAELDRQITRSNRLRQSTLHEAFKGRI